MDRPYWLFAGQHYYAAGGMRDFRGQFATESEAVDEIRRLVEVYKQWYDSLEDEDVSDPALIQWYQIVDIASCRIVRHYGGGGCGSPCDYHNGAPEWPAGVTAAAEDAQGQSLLMLPQSPT